MTILVIANPSNELHSFSEILLVDWLCDLVGTNRIKRFKDRLCVRVRNVQGKTMNEEAAADSHNENAQKPIVAQEPSSRNQPISTGRRVFTI
jgi:hypothetical protein